jgi:hypothetical protein
MQATTNWRAALPLLDGHGLALLPIGAKAPERKAPVDPQTGYGLKDWQHSTGYSVAALAGMNPAHVIAIGVNTGHGGILVLDIDGASAADWIRQRGLDPASASTWHITRNTDPSRYKLVFRLTPEQQAAFPQTKLLLRTTQGEALEIYCQPGAQVLVLGEHCKSGGMYGWVNGPADIAAPTDEWMDVFHAIQEKVQELRGKGDPSRPPRVKGISSAAGRWEASGAGRPCPICGRERSAACTWLYASGRRSASCFHGSGDLLCPQGLKAGDVITGHDGGKWAFVRTYIADCLGEKSLFVDDQPKPPRSATQQPMPQAAIPTSSPAVEMPAIDQARLRLKELIAQGLSGSALTTKILELADEYNCHPAGLQKVVQDLQTEDDATLQADAELAGIRRAGELEEERKAFRLEDLVPAQCVEPLRYLSTSLQVDDLATAMIFLTCASGVVRAGTRIWGDELTFAERPQIWLGLVGKSGLGKSPAMRNLGVTPTSLVKRHYHHRNEQRQAAWDKANPEDRGPEPQPFVFQVSNYTAGAIVKQFAVNEAERLGVLLACDELAALFSSLNEFQSKGRGSEQEQLLSLFDNNGDAQIRVKDGYRTYEEAHMSVIGGIQPLVFDQLASHGDPAGLFARLLLLPLPTDYRGDNKPVNYSKETTHAHQAILESLVLHILDLPPTGYQLSKDAEHHHRIIRREAHALADRSVLLAHSNIYGKRAGYVLRIAGIIHILRVVAGEIHSLDTQVVTLDTVQLAERLVAHLQEYALSAQTRAAQAAEGTITELMRTIHRFALDKQVSAGKFRSDALTPAKRKLYSIQAVLSYVQRLVDAGLADWLPGNPRNGSRSFTCKGRLPG